MPEPPRLNELGQTAADVRAEDWADARDRADRLAEHAPHRWGSFASGADFSSVRAETLRELRQVLAELELISQVSASTPGSGGGDQGEDIGGKRPPGGLDRAGDRPDDHEHIYPQKSYEYFRRRVGRIRSQWQAERLLEQARESLEASRRQPRPSDRPELSSPQWKRWVAESDLPPREIARVYNVSRSYVERIRARYRAA